MHLSRMVVSRSVVVGGLTATLLSLVAADVTTAQPRPIPVDARGYQRLVMMQENLEARATGPLQTTGPVARSGPTMPRRVTLRSPNGRVRSFLLEGEIRIQNPDGTTRPASK